MLRDLLREAYGAMQHNRRRTTLTMLGMAWGIATVVILLAFGSGFERAINIIFSSPAARRCRRADRRPAARSGCRLQTWSTSATKCR